MFCDLSPNSQPAWNFEDHFEFPSINEELAFPVDFTSMEI